MFSLILDIRFKNICRVLSLIKYEQRKVIVENYDTKSLYPMLLKCHKHLHLLVEFENDFANQEVDEDFSLDIFEMTVKQQ
jgi:hypothetical protein